MLTFKHETRLHCFIRIAYRWKLFNNKCWQKRAWTTIYEIKIIAGLHIDLIIIIVAPYNQICLLYVECLFIFWLLLSSLVVSILLLSKQFRTICFGVHKPNMYTCFFSFGTSFRALWSSFIVGSIQNACKRCEKKNKNS